MRALVLLIALAIAFAGCLATPTDEPVEPQGDARTDDAALRPIVATFEGSATGTPAMPSSEEFLFTIPTGAVGLNGTLAWDDPVARFRLTLIDPYGEVVQTGYPEQDGILRVATVEPPASGEWTFRIEGTLALDVPFELEAVAELLVPQDNLVRKTTQMAARTFHEINVIMEANATFTFRFDASAPITWDVHSHPEGGVKYWDEGEGTSHEGSFTAPERGIYSLLFENANALPADITYEMTGAFRLHSHAQ